MSKVAVVFWSGSGNTEAMAAQVEAGASAAGADVSTVAAADFTADALASYDAVAFGCPAMGAEVLEEVEFQPMWDDIKGSLSGKKIGLFGSYGWGSGQWMDDWRADAEAAGANVVDAVIANDAPDDDAQAQCRDLGKALA